MRPGWPTREAATYNGLRALLIVVTATSFFFALGRLPLADAIAMSFISPALTRCWGPCCSGEARLAHRPGTRRRLLRHVTDRRRQARGRGIGEEVLIGAAAVSYRPSAIAQLIMLRHRATRDPLAQSILFQNLGPA